MPHSGGEASRWVPSRPTSTHQPPDPSIHTTLTPFGLTRRCYCCQPLTTDEIEAQTESWQRHPYHEAGDDDDDLVLRILGAQGLVGLIRGHGHESERVRAFVARVGREYYE